MNRTLPPGDYGHRNVDPFRASRAAGSLPGVNGLVGRVADSYRPETRKAAGVESGGGKNQASAGSAFDGVGALIADHLAGYGQPVVLGQGAACAEHGPRGVLLPAHFGHDLFEGRAAFALEHLDYAAGLAFCAGSFRGLFACGRFGLAGGLLGRRFLRGRNVGRLFADVGLRFGSGRLFRRSLFGSGLQSRPFASGSGSGTLSLATSAPRL